jgi:hypothetical protein
LAVKRLFQAAVKAGRIVRPNHCSDCGAACKPDGHHSDYAKPYNVTWLCRRCHVNADRLRRLLELERAA